MRDDFTSQPSTSCETWAVKALKFSIQSYAPAAPAIVVADRLGNQWGGLDDKQSPTLHLKSTSAPKLWPRPT